VSVRGTFKVRHLKIFDYFSVSYFIVNHKSIKDSIKGNQRNDSLVQKDLLKIAQPKQMYH